MTLRAYIIANIIAIPVVALIIVPLVLLASLSFLIFGHGVIDQNLYQLADFILQYLWRLLDSLAVAETAVGFLPEQSFASFAGLMFSFFILEHRMKTLRIIAWTAICCSTILILGTASRKGFILLVLAGAFLLPSYLRNLSRKKIVFILAMLICTITLAYSIQKSPAYIYWRYSALIKKIR